MRASIVLDSTLMFCHSLHASDDCLSVSIVEELGRVAGGVEVGGRVSRMRSHAHVSSPFPVVTRPFALRTARVV